MGAWIEIQNDGTGATYVMSHPTMGAWIEILIKSTILGNIDGRTPRWVRGLKLDIAIRAVHDYVVAPHDGCVD